ncbi:hypothetical protein CLSAP_17070 [Clostridium saccharoperbutylacetonicum]|nr:hypothetical protein CLSAP_17070 [Clostridium saccharoperbutylacetonicum]NSB30102.1 flagellar biogenesis protein FliO [Clostridium saccharoperbutylacetonicum]
MSTILISLIAIIAFVLGIIYKDKLISKFSQGNQVNEQI